MYQQLTALLLAGHCQSSPHSHRSELNNQLHMPTTNKQHRSVAAAHSCATDTAANHAGCAPDVVLVLRDMKGNTVCRLRAVKAILAAWSPVLRGAIELGSSSNNSSSQQDPPIHGPIHGSSSSGCLTSYGSTNCSVIPNASTSSPAAGICSSPECSTTTGSSNTAAVAAAVASSSSSWGGLELPMLVEGHKEVEAWKVAMCLMHPLDPTCGKTPSSLITTCAIKPLVTLADKYNLQVRC